MVKSSVVQIQRTVSFGFLYISESENCRFWFFESFSPHYFKNFKEPVFMKEIVKNRCFSAVLLDFHLLGTKVVNTN
jgi:hypothetical protein